MATMAAPQEKKVTRHEKGRYALFDGIDQTPKKYISKYRVGFGIILTRNKGKESFKISSYKEFLAKLLETAESDQLIAFKWIPSRLHKGKTLDVQQLICTPLPCQKTCVQKGCLCVSGECA